MHTSSLLCPTGEDGVGRALGQQLADIVVHVRQVQFAELPMLGGLVPHQVLDADDSSGVHNDLLVQHCVGHRRQTVDVALDLRHPRVHGLVGVSWRRWRW